MPEGDTVWHTAATLREALVGRTLTRCDVRVPRYATDGTPLGFVGSAVDIHERKALEESLAERTQALRLAERRQGQFLAMLSHELRNPLAPIANAASVLRTLEHSNVLLDRGEADAVLARKRRHRLLLADHPLQNVPPCGRTKRVEDAVGLLVCEITYNHLVVGYLT